MSGFDKILKLDEEGFNKLMSKSYKTKIKEVILNRLVLYKIISHCDENLREEVSGQLLGLNNKSVLEITDSYPMVSTTEENENSYDIESDYQSKMISTLQEMNVDNNVVGWYMSSYMGSYLDLNLLQGQFQYQLDYGKMCVCLIYDPILSKKQSSLVIKAVRLTEGMMQVLKKADNDLKSTKTYQITQEFLSHLKLTSNDILEEISVKIKSDDLLYKNVKSCDLFYNEESEEEEEEEIDSGFVIEKSLEKVLDSVDVLTQEQSKFCYYYRRKSQLKNVGKKGVKIDVTLDDKKPLLSPNRFDSLATTFQIRDNCGNVDKVIENVKKLKF